MKTVWLLISPVLLLMNSAVTNSGAAYVMSLSLHSSTEALTSSKRGSEKDRDIEPEKSSIGESSARISSRPPTTGPSPRSAAFARQRSEPINHSKESVCRSRSPGTSSGSRIFANETLFGGSGGDSGNCLGLARDCKMRPSSTSRGPLQPVRPPLYLLLQWGAFRLVTTRTSAPTTKTGGMRPARRRFRLCDRGMDRRQPAQRTNLHRQTATRNKGARNKPIPETRLSGFRAGVPIE